MIIAQTAVGPSVRVADPGLLGSAMTRPSMSVFGEDAYPGLERKAAALMESLARNHVLVDGNKRLAWTATVVFLRINGFDLTYTSVDEAEAFVLAVAADHLSLEGIETWIADHTAPV
ncbi:MAG: type II toxin-antitoxin system death-on-curing family toxin [Propionibacteriaceae bacterium]|nr:MAG: type II toxin-antitoxin system death-on-curing family toxin [Propionibacteriaceae bacterium]